MNLALHPTDRAYNITYIYKMKINSITIAITIITALILTGCSGGDDDNSSNNSRNNSADRAPTVEAVQARYGGLPLEERLTGVVRAKNQTEIYAQISAPIVEVLVNDGDPVVKGQALVRLRDTNFKERLRQAESGLQIADAQVRQAAATRQQAEARLNRVRTLSERDLSTAAELETLEAELESADASLNLARAQRDQAASVVEERKEELENTIVTSPTAGVVGRRNAEVGQQVTPNTQLFLVGDVDNVDVSINLTERMLSYIEVGQTAAVYSEAMTDTLIRSTLARISPFLDPVTHSTTAQLDIPNPGRLLRPGMFVTVDVFYGESDQATLIPNNAIYNNPRQGSRGVFVAETSNSELTLPGDENGSGNIYGPFPVRFIPIDIVAEGREISGVRGIDSGDWVVTVGQNLLIRGQQQARFRPMSWERILRLQGLQSQDIINLIEEKLANQSQSDTSGTGA